MPRVVVVDGVRDIPRERDGITARGLLRTGRSSVLRAVGSVMLLLSGLACTILLITPTENAPAQSLPPPVHGLEKRSEVATDDEADIDLSLDLEDPEEVFLRKVDLDGSSEASAEELAYSEEDDMALFSSKAWESVVSRFDTDQSGGLSFEEWRRWQVLTEEEAYVNLLIADWDERGDGVDYDVPMALAGFVPLALTRLPRVHRRSTSGIT